MALNIEVGRKKYLDVLGLHQEANNGKSKEK
jgi:hypothetical protein